METIVVLEKCLPPSVPDYTEARTVVELNSCLAVCKDNKTVFVEADRVGAIIAKITHMVFAVQI